MPFYNDLRPPADHKKKDYALIFPEMTTTEKKRTITNLLGLKNGLDAQIPPRKADNNLIVASWNIKEFGHTTQRLPEAYFYIAEILARFDLVVVQEVKSTLRDLDIIMRLLGGDWDFLVNDITSGGDGNSERSAYLFNRKRVRLSGVAGELVLWDDLTEGANIKQLKRTPFLTGFKAGWKNFALLSLHLQPGESTGNVAYRKEEVSLLLAALTEKMKEHWTKSLVLAGDFNFYQNKDDEAVALMNDDGYSEVDGLVGLDTNAAQTQAYDRMFIKQSDYFCLARDANDHSIGGVFNPFDFVYREGEETTYKDEIIAVYGGNKDLANDAAALEKQYRVYWKRNQISDHFPIWFELITDSSAMFLENKLEDFNSV